MRDDRGRPNPDIEQIDGKMFQLFALVVEALAAATDALLSGDKHVAAVLSGRPFATPITRQWQEHLAPTANVSEIRR